MHGYLIFMASPDRYGWPLKTFWSLCLLPCSIMHALFGVVLISMVTIQVYCFACRLKAMKNQMCHVISLYRQAQTSSTPSTYSFSIFVSRALRVTHDWKVVEQEFTAQATTQDAIYGILLPVCGFGVLFWIYFMTHLIGVSHVTLIVGGAQLLTAMSILLISVSLTVPLIATARERYVTALFSLYSCLSSAQAVRFQRWRSLIRLRRHLLRLIQNESRDTDEQHRQELIVRCGPLFPLTYHVMWTLFAELAMLYLLFTRALDQLTVL